MIDFADTDRDRFLRAAEIPKGGEPGIGTLNERSVHAVLKRYIEPDADYHEVPVGRFFADIARDGVICEIQTSRIYSLSEKLRHFLEHSDVILVTPQILRRHTLRVCRRAADGKRTFWEPWSPLRPGFLIRGCRSGSLFWMYAMSVWPGKREGAVKKPIPFRRILSTLFLPGNRRIFFPFSPLLSRRASQ